MSRDLCVGDGARAAKKACQSRTSCIATPRAWRCFGIGYEVFSRGYHELLQLTALLYAVFEPRRRSVASGGRRSMKTVGCALMLAVLPAVAGAAERPDWAFPPPGVTGAPRKPETGELKRVPGSNKTYTQSQIDSFNDPPDWFPDDHHPMPAIVAHGRGREVRACISCHLSTGQ